MRIVLAAALVVAFTTAAWAQDDDTSRRLSELERKLEEQGKRLEAQERELEALRRREEPRRDEKASSLALGWKDGAFVKGELGGASYELRPIGRLQLDYRLFARSKTNPTVPHALPHDHFVVRRPRVGFLGHFSVFGFVLEVDPTRSFPLGNFFFQYQQLEEAQVRFGHYRAPFTFENGMNGTNQAPFLERSMVIGSGNAAAPGFLNGAEVTGSFGKGLLAYWISAQNQVDGNTITSGEPLLTARLQSTVSIATVGVSGIWTRHTQGDKSITGVTPAQYAFFSAVNVAGWDQRYAADVTVFKGPFFGMLEYVWLRQEREKVLAGKQDGEPFVVQGGYLGFGWLFAGPTKEKRSLVPFEGWTLFPLDVERPRSGRFSGAELVCRLEWIDLDDGRGRRLGGVTAGPSRAADATNVKGTDARAVTVGLNLFPIDNVRVSAEWVHVRVGDQGRAAHPSTRFQDELVFRAQLDF